MPTVTTTSALLSRLAKHSARQAIAAGDNPLVLLNGHTGGAREIMKAAIVEEMRSAVERARADACFYRTMNAQLRGKQ